MKQDPNDFVTLTTASSEFEAGVIAAALTAQGIEARPLASAMSQVYGGMLGPGLIDQARVIVHASDLERAAAALKETRQDSVDIDWSEVDVGQPEDPASAAILPRRLARRTWPVLVALLLISRVAWSVGRGMRWW